ncbi:MAG: hypothetical protein JSV65_11455 [Armatimonadota bacterium]|nr:MAG: hypothetical protein JSV65_11455 [Armatimonadota bacterium]
MPMFASADERTSFQSGAAYNPRIDIKSDVAMVYGVDDSLPERLAGWRDRGYRVHVMTGVAWGSYQDYLYGKFDGQEHLDDAQVRRDGEKISHGGDVYYMVPTVPYTEMLKQRTERVVDAGALALHMEEPEFWVAGGYSPSFRREWEAYYGTPWQAPHSSPAAQYMASKLKYALYRRCLDGIFSHVKSYARERGKNIACYVPTHSMLNYAHWGIVSPESSLAALDSCDGYIGQVWTGTARTPNLYRGVARERTFETAFLEYGVLHNLVRATGKRMWYLADPVEDNPEHSWADYGANYERTVVASLLFPDVWRFEVMPWPRRIFQGRYPKVDVKQRGQGPAERKEGIPADYATEVLTIINALNDMKQEQIAWDCGTPGVGVLVSDTMMFQRGEPSPTDPNSFYGLALPLLKRGIPVHPVQMEHAHRKGYLAPYRLLLLSYELMKPPSVEAHQALARWVKAGGALVYVGDGSDPHHAVPEWWNTEPMGYDRPEHHLFELLGLGLTPTAGTHRCGKGVVGMALEHPVSFARSADGPERLLEVLRRAWDAARLGEWRERNYLKLDRGPYVIAAALDEGTGERVMIRRWTVDLLDPMLRVGARKTLAPGQVALLRAFEPGGGPTVLASASRVTDVRSRQGEVAFHSQGPAATTASTRIALPAPPKSVSILDSAGADHPFEREWHSRSKTLLLRYENLPDGVTVHVEM